MNQMLFGTLISRFLHLSHKGKQTQEGKTEARVDGKAPQGLLGCFLKSLSVGRVVS